MKAFSSLIICLTLISCQVAKGQVILTPKLTVEEYKVINDLFGDKEIVVNLYSETDFSKTWSYIMHPKHLDALFGPPCNNGKEIISWDTIFPNDDFNKIRDEIIKLRPYKLKKTELSENIILTDKYTTSNKTDDVVIITKPIILNEFAIIKQSDLVNELIIVASKSSGKWETICRKWVVMIIDD